MSRLQKIIFCVFVIGFILYTPAWAADKKPVFVFASEDEGRSLLAARDEFIENMSPLDRSVRMRSEKPVSVDEFLKFVGNNVVSWEDEDKERVQTVVGSLASKFEAYSRFLPGTIYLIRTTGNEEGGVAYTRGNAIIFPRRLLTTDIVVLYRLVSHELFHIITRQNKAMKSEFYSIIGFSKCPSYTLPGTLGNRRFTNPDAPLNDHCIRVKAGKKELVMLPLLYSQVDAYSKADGEQLFDYVRSAFLSIASVKKGQKPVMLKENQMTLYQEEELQGLYEQIGKNTDYIIHPEEILADNFSYLFLGVTEMESPRIVEKMKKVFEQKRQ